MGTLCAFLSDMERSYTDFLFPDPTLLAGAATIFCLGGPQLIYNASGSQTLADARAIRQDFAMIGQDIKDVIAKVKEKSAEQLSLGL